MFPGSDADLLLAYLDGSLSDEDAERLQSRLKAEPALAELLVALARDEAVIAEWAAAARAAEAPVPLVPRRPAARRFAFRAAAVAAVLVVGVIAAYFGFRPAAGPGPGPEPIAAVARLDDVQGEAFLVAAGGPAVPAQAGQELFPGQEVRTGEGGFAVLQFPDATRLELSSETALRLLDGGKRVFLAAGALHADVADQPAGRPMEVATPHAVIFAPGARFTSAAGADATRVELEAGHARMTRADDPRSVEVGPGRVVVAGPGRGQLKSRALPPRATEPRMVLPGGTGPVTVVAVPARRDLLAVGGWDGTLFLYDPQTGQPRAALKEHTRTVRALAFDAEGAVLVSGGNDKFVRVWDPGTGNVRLVLPKQKRDIDSVALSPDGKTLAVSAGAIKGVAQLRLFDPQTGQELASLPGHSEKVEGLAFGPAGRLLASAGRDGNVKIWDAMTGQPLATLPAHVGGAQAVAFSPDGKTLASGGRDGLVKLWDVETLALRQTLAGHPREVRSLAFSPDGKLLASAGGEPNVRLWDAGTGREVKSFRANKYVVCTVAFTPDGRTLVTGGWDRTVKLWDVGER